MQEEDEGSQEFATSEEDRTADSTGSSRHFVPFDPFTLPTLYSTYVVPRAQNRASAPPSSDGAPEVATPSAPTSARKRKEPLEEYDPAAVSDESELTEQEDEADRNDDEERDEDEEDASDAEDSTCALERQTMLTSDVAPKIASKRSRSTRSVSVSADSPVAGTTGKRIKIPSAKKSAAKRPAVAKRAKVRFNFPPPRVKSS